MKTMDGRSRLAQERETPYGTTLEEPGIIDVPPVGNSPDQICSKIDINVL